MSEIIEITENQPAVGWTIKEIRDYVNKILKEHKMIKRILIEPERINFTYYKIRKPQNPSRRT